MTSYIGWWGARLPAGKWHLVESEVTNRMVMRCGRQMRIQAIYGRTLVFDADPGGERCEQCTNRKVAD